MLCIKLGGKIYERATSVHYLTNWKMKKINPKTEQNEQKSKIKGIKLTKSTKRRQNDENKTISEVTTIDGTNKGIKRIEEELGKATKQFLTGSLSRLASP
uniref:Uncharacterized protein n=2 Tax=Meloidogyne TaxID=189290 RepID=A0A914N672_MELIC